MTPNPKTLIDLLRWRATHQPNRVGYTFLTDGETEENTLTYRELDRQARAIAAGLHSLVSPGDRVLLLYPPGLEYIAAFFGCLYAGAVAVPAYPPRRNRNLLRLQAVVADAQATVALTTASTLTRIVPFFSQNPYLAPLRWLTSDSVTEGMEKDWQEPAITGEALAFLQYTSGSTSVPKGVMLSHSNLLHNEQLIRKVFRQNADSVIAGWLPLFHDMGLIGNVIQPLFIGARCILMSPGAFLQRPFRWLQAISRYRATTSGGPNFAYDLCVRRISAEKRATLDLSSWRVAFNGSEPVRFDTLENFVATFETCGFRRDAFRPCYGLAEATLLVSGRLKADAPIYTKVQAKALEFNRAVEVSTADNDNVRTMVSCGETLPGQKVLVVHPENLSQCQPQQVGEIWVAGPSIAQGYWNRPEDTARVFNAYLADTGAGPYLRTGDLGFQQNGNLYVTGRLKDLIIIRGFNHYPQDIEHSVEQCHQALHPGCGAAFSIEIGGEERLVIVQELDRRQQIDAQALIKTICETIVENHEVQVYAIQLIKAGNIPKTSSGKIQRQVCRTAFLEKNLEVVVDWRRDLTGPDAEVTGAVSALQSSDAIEGWLRLQLAEKLNLNPQMIDVDQPIAGYGLDSLAAIELMHSAQTELGVTLPLSTFLQSPSLSRLAAEAREQLAAFSSAHKSALTRTHEAIVEHPLSRSQQALWFLHRMAPESTAYNIAHAVRILSELDVLALEHAFQGLVDRHQPLRTTFASVNGEPIQRIHERIDVCLVKEDASDWSEGQWHARLVAEAHRPFDLEQGPLLRVYLFKRAASEHVLLMTVHHIVTDFWSLAVLMQELGELYVAERDGLVAQLAPLTLQYTDYVRWQEEMLAGTEGERLWSYWQKQLAGELPVLNFASDRPRPSVQTFRGASMSFKLSAELTAELKALSQSHGATLYMTLLAAFQTLLHRYTGQTEILVGSPTAGRNWVDLSNLVGYFANPIVLRADLAGHHTFESFLCNTRQIALDAFKHQDYPFALLVERLQPVRDPRRSPLFQAMFVLQKVHLRKEDALVSFALGESGVRMKLGGLLMESVALDQEIAQFDLTLMMADTAGTLSATFQYNTDLFEAQTINRLSEHFRTLLQAIVENPEQKLSMLSVLSPAEKHQLLVGFNHTSRDFPPHLSLPQLFEQQVERSPDSIALIFEDQQLTYRHLNARANQLAHLLQRRGIAPDVLVGVLMHRSVEMVVSLLAIFKAGSAYVPLDPDYPPHRLSFMMADAAMPVLLTQSHLLDSLPPERPPIVIALDEAADHLASEPADNPRSRTTGQNLAYCIYTSGSTGQPKGAMNTHQAICNRLLWMQEAYRLNSSDRVLQKTIFSFDVSVWEFFWPLVTGAQLVMARPGGHRDSTYLARVIREQQITTIHFVPSMLQVFLEEKEVERCLSLKRVVCSGETLSWELQKRFFSKFREVELHNLYGPTEAAIDVTWWACERESSLGVVPIGRAIANTEMYILDREMNPVPLGVAGELYIGGIQLARGYLKRPQLTAARFIPHPFSLESGERLYRTGDMACFYGDGNIKYLGRVDQQVKVRGLRIELGEIEETLRKHRAVLDAAIIAREDVPGDKRLVAYVVLDAESWSEAEELRRYLQERLPDYMIPAAFVMLAEMPVTSNGKIDRRALPAPDYGVRESERDTASARTAIEEVLAAIWAQVLRVERVGLKENFFALGGHSLLATQVISRVREVFGVDVLLRHLFESPTVSGFAQRIETAIKEQQGLQSPAIGPVSRSEALPLSFAQERLWFLDKLATSKHVYNMPAAVRLEGLLNLTALAQALSEIVARHEVLRTAFPVTDGRPVQVILPARPLSLPVTNLGHLSEEEREAEVKRLCAEEAQRPFDLAEGLLLRASLLRLGEAEHVLLLTMHHIVGDGWSIGIFVRELTALYAAFLNEQPSPLVPLPIQYADYVHWQREWLQGEVLTTQLAYWKQQLANAPPVLALSFDYPRPAIQTYNGASQPFTLTRSLTDALKTLSRQQDVTLFMTLLAAFQVLLHRYTGQTEIVIGSPIANRHHQETEALIGCFVNLLVLRTSVVPELSFSEVLERVRQVALNAYAHQDVPFELLVETLQPQRDLSYSPLVQVLLVLQNAPDEELEFAQLSSRLLPVERDVAQYDLSLHLWEKTQGLSGFLEYNTDLFDEQTITRLLGHFRNLLEAVVAEPARQLADIPLLSPGEEHTLLVEWNNTRVAYPPCCVHELFEAQVARTPEAIALVCGDERLSYAELNRRANHVAHYLSSRGVGPETLVGVLMHRSVEMVVALLGVLKAGGAYVPLDPTYPAERLAFMLKDSAASVLLTQQALRHALPSTPAEEVALDDIWPLVSQGEAGNPTGTATEENLFYVIYTSGSTGRPKGVAITHGSVQTLIQWAKTVYEPDDLSGVLASTSICFDISVFELFVPLSWGGKVILAETAIQLPVLPAAAEVSLVNTVPSAMTELLRMSGIPETVRVVNLAGEVLTNALAQQVYELTNARAVWNLYGPTEDTVYSTSALIKKGDPGKPPIGRPLTNAQVYVLDAQLQAVPVGVVGELYLGGLGLGRAYLKRPALTAEKFVPHPFTAERGARLYRTGDLARFRPDGQLECCGRSDYQVKIRGFRIEPGEIERLLLKHPAVKEAIVIAREYSPGEKRLVAYLVGQQEIMPSVSEWHIYLKQQLPSYMIPSAFMVMDELPLTPNGKVDRRALPAPDAHRPALSASYIAPQGGVEQTVAGIWQEVLNVDRVGVHDNFFELGGHSLSLVHAHSKLQDRLRVNLSIIDMFRLPTVRSLTKHLTQADDAQKAMQDEATTIEKMAAGKNRLQKLFKQGRRATDN